MKNKEKIREIIVYFIFGILTTVVGMGTYFGILLLGEYALNIPPESNAFNIVRVVAQLIHWVAAVLFAYFTNKKWVFTNADNNVSTITQLTKFAASRLATLGLDTAITFGTVWLLQAFAYQSVSIVGIQISADLISKVAASVVVIVTNYILSKIFVFKTKSEE